MPEINSTKPSYISETKSGGRFTPVKYHTVWNVASVTEEDMHAQYSNRGTRNGRVLFMQDVKARTNAAVLMLLHQSWQFKKLCG